MKYMQMIYLKVLTDIPCEVYIDNDLVSVIKKNVISKIAINRGDYFIKIVSTFNPNIFIDEIIHIEYDKILKIDFLKKTEFSHILSKYIYWDNHIYAFRNIFTNEQVSKSYPHNTSYISTGEFYDDMSLVGISGKCGYVNRDGKEVVECIYDFIDYFHEGLASASINRKFGYIDKEGNVVIPFIYDNAERFSEGLAAVKINNLWGFIDKNGNEVVPCVYDSTGIFSEGLAAVKIWGEGWGYIDRYGHLTIQPKYSVVEKFHNGIAIVRIDTWCAGCFVDSKYGCIDKEGNIVVDFIYDNLSILDNGLIEAQAEDKWGCITNQGEVIIPFIYDFLSFGDDDTDIAVAEIEGKFGFIDKTGNTIIPCTYDYADCEFSEGCVGVKKDGKGGFIDKAGNVVIPFIYDDVGYFSQGLARIRVGMKEIDGKYDYGKCGFINKCGEKVILCLYDNAKGFSDGYAWVLIGSEIIHIDKYGNQL